MTLADLKKGDSAIIEDIKDSDVASKLFESGVLPGNKLEVMNVAPFSGPVYIKIDDSLIAIRKREAKSIVLEK